MANNNNKSTKKNTSKKKSKHHLIVKKINYYFDIIENTTSIIQKYKIMDILTSGQLNITIQKLQELYINLTNIYDVIKTKTKNKNYDEIINKLQTINNELSIIFRNHGTYNIVDILNIQFGNHYYDHLIKSNIECDKLNILKKYVHPINYKILSWKEDKPVNKTLPKNKIIEDFMIVDTGKTMDCFDLARSSNTYQIKVSGIKICFQNHETKKTIILCAIVDDIVLQCCNLPYIKNLLDTIKLNKPLDDHFQNKDFDRFLESLTLKELLIYNKEELYHKYNGMVNQNLLVKQKTISDIVKDFLALDLYRQRNILIQLLIKYDNPEYQYLAYLLYDLLSNETNGIIDTQEQTILFDSMPWNIKKSHQNSNRALN